MIKLLVTTLFPVKTSQIMLDYSPTNSNVCTLRLFETNSSPLFIIVISQFIKFRIKNVKKNTIFISNYFLYENKII